MSEKILVCKISECPNKITRHSKSGLCYHCSLKVRRNPTRKPIKKINCKNSECKNLVSENSKIGLCQKCYGKERPPKKLEKNITYICPNPTHNPDCLKGILVDKYGFTESVKHETFCKKCAPLKMVQTRMNNNSYTHSDKTKKLISETQKQQHLLGERISWNIGLTANTDCRVAKTGKSRPGKLNPMFGCSFRDVWKEMYSEDEFNEKMDYNGYLKSESLLPFEVWKVERDKEITAYNLYRKEVYYCTDKQPIKTLPNYEKRGKHGIDGAYQLDHIVPIKYGFDKNIKPEHIGSIGNLWFVPWEINSKKGGSFYKLLFYEQYYPISQYGNRIFNQMLFIMKHCWNFKESLPKLKRIN